MRTASDHTDHELLSALMEDDRYAFEVIYRKYVRYLFNYLRKNIAAKEDCEEIIQEIFEALWTKRSTLRIQTSLKAYLLGMARYKIVHYFRKGTLRRKYAEHFALFEAVYAEADDAEINHPAIQSTLEKLITELPERCQEALKLRLSEDLSNPDIAKRMNISTRTVEAYMFRAFNHIRSSYKQFASHVSVVFLVVRIMLA